MALLFQTIHGGIHERNVIFVNEQLQLMVDHREATVRVLNRVRRHQAAIKQLYAVAKAAAVALCGKGSKLRRGGSKAPSGAETSNDDGEHERNQIMRFRGVLIDACRRAQHATVQVVEAILAWRQHLWRPQPFKWKGKNYLIRIGNCVGLQQFVVDENVIEAVKKCGIHATELRSLLPPTVRANLCDSTALVPEVRTVSDDTASSGIDSGLDAERAVDLQRLAECEDAVRDEPRVYREVIAETDELLRRGYYIPRSDGIPTNHRRRSKKKRRRPGKEEEGGGEGDHRRK